MKKKNKKRTNPFNLKTEDWWEEGDFKRFYRDPKTCDQFIVVDQKIYKVFMTKQGKWIKIPLEGIYEL